MKLITLVLTFVALGNCLFGFGGSAGRMGQKCRWGFLGARRKCFGGLKCVHNVCIHPHTAPATVGDMGMPCKMFRRCNRAPSGMQLTCMGGSFLGLSQGGKCCLPNGGVMGCTNMNMNSAFGPMGGGMGALGPMGMGMMGQGQSQDSRCDMGLSCNGGRCQPRGVGMGGMMGMGGYNPMMGRMGKRQQMPGGYMSGNGQMGRRPGGFGGRGMNVVMHRGSMKGGLGQPCRFKLSPGVIVAIVIGSIVGLVLIIVIIIIILKKKNNSAPAHNDHGYSKMRGGYDDDDEDEY